VGGLPWLNPADGRMKDGIYLFIFYFYFILFPFPYWAQAAPRYSARSPAQRKKRKKRKTSVKFGALEEVFMSYRPHGAWRTMEVLEELA
jgi:hypothetical protein